MTRLWREGDPITVVANAAGEPGTFIWRGQAHRVAAITRRWRLDIEWWHGRILAGIERKSFNSFYVTNGIPAKGATS